jgi:death-on-curing protein
LRSEPRWLTPDDLVELNRLIVQSTGEPFGLRDQALLESACGKPEQHWHYDQQDDVATLATTLLFGIAQNHPFIQGNKRTGFEAALTFLRINGWRVDVRFDEVLGDRIIAALTNVGERDAFAEFIGACIYLADAP